ncbi:MAG TPA: 2-amino-4-hydroxy-6-hydroxymethyldihydropteridine diphosphokinase, partial [Candidatus Limnocylindrales bacterium]|nr:2-amino-4-hydroxy-6-hydroxymethyldihydropteridine diphosphokinase [Candidatus Limnocylindrales bacterium]
MGRVRAYVGLGANVGSPAETLEAAVHALAALPGARLRGVSRLYATDPVGVVDQPEFRNAVVALDVPAGPTPERGAV